MQSKYDNARSNFIKTAQVTERQIRKCKPWLKVRCDQTKCKQINDYGHALFKTIQSNIPHCKRAQLSLSLGDQTVNYSWKKKELRNSKCDSSESDTFNFSKKSDHSYASPKLLQCESEDDELHDINYGTIFDSDGNWQTHHKRGIINVMDSYRISHEAYHELRQAGKGHFPPLYKIHKEKSIMSAAIPYNKHESVSAHIY